ncbi:MAG: hypothetical protein J6P16_02085 [Eubacterium sp.]|nr:hypothetical protein [Eubacterium sp.]
MTTIYQKTKKTIVFMTLFGLVLSGTALPAADMSYSSEAASAKVSLKKKTASLVVTQNKNKRTYGKTRIKVKKAKGVKIKKITYRSNDTTVAKVNKKGIVTAKSMGAAGIRVRVKYIYKNKVRKTNLTFKTRVTYKYKNILQGLELKKDVFATYLKSDYTNLRGTEGIKPMYISNRKLKRDFYLWDVLKTKVADTSVAEIGEAGLIIPKKVGETTVTISSTDGSKLSVTAGIRVVADERSMPVNDDLYMSARAKLIDAQMKGWTEEDKQRFISEDGSVSFDYLSFPDYEAEDTLEEIRAEYTTIGKQTDNTAEDALSSMLSTAEALKDPAEQSRFLQILGDRIVAPIKNVKTMNELVSLCQDMAVEGFDSIYSLAGFGKSSKNYDTYEEVMNTGVAPDEVVEMGDYYSPMLSGKTFITDNVLYTETGTDNLDELFYSILKYMGYDDKTVAGDTTRFIIKLLKKVKKDDYDLVCQIKDVKKEFPALKIVEAMEKKGYSITDDTEVIVNYPLILEIINKAVKNEDNLNALKGLATLCAVKDCLSFNKNIIRLLQDFTFDNGMGGYGGAETKSEEFIDTFFDGVLKDVHMMIPWDYDHVFTKKVFEPGFKEAFISLTEDYRQAYLDAINASDYSDFTKKNFTDKVNAMKFYNLYPSDEEYEVLEMDQDLSTAAEGANFCDNIIKYAKYIADLEKLTLGPVGGHVAWYSPTNSVMSSDGPWINNAFYSSTENSCYLLHGGIGHDVLFQYDPTGKDVSKRVHNISFLATTIGHEMGHGFDNSGTLFNKDGNIQNIFDQTDREKYNKKVKLLSEYYDNLMETGDVETDTAYYQSGDVVITEAMADLGGTEIALKILKKEYPGRDDLVRDFFDSTPMQWMNTNEDFVDPDTILSRLENEHPFSRTRANGVASMIDEFYRAYDVKEGDAMYVAPENRVSLWG